MNCIPVPQNCVYGRAVFFDGKTKGKAFPQLLFCRAGFMRGTARLKPGMSPEDMLNDVKEAVNFPSPVLVIEKASKVAVLDVGNTILQ
jgi:hypothetical protein